MLRYVMVSYAGARPEHGVPRDDDFFAYAEAKAAADSFLRTTSLEWTILGPGTLILDAPSGLITVIATDAITATAEDSNTSRANVAAVIAAVLGQDATIKSTIRFTDGATPITEAIMQSERP